MIRFLICQFLISQVGWASFYDCSWNGNKTASGEVYNCQKFTAAAHSRNLFNKLFKITNLKNKKSIIVKINDICGNDAVIIDLSLAAFKEIAKVETGIIKIKMEELK